MKPDTKAAKRSYLTWVLRLTGSALFLTAVFYFLPLSEVMAAARRLNPAIWISALLIFLTGHVLASLKWRMLLNARTKLPAHAFVRAHFAGLAANLALPGVAGGDVVRATMIIRRTDDSVQTAAGSLLDRLLDTLGLLILAFLGGVWFYGAQFFDQRLLFTIGAMIAAGAASVAGYFVLRKMPIGPLAKIMDKIDTLIADFARQPLRLTSCLLLSMAIQSTFIATTILLARATVADASVAQWFFAWPLAKIIAILPISLAGLGVREASLAAILGGLGANPAGIVAASLLWQSILFAGGIIGGLILLLASSNSNQRNATTDNQTPIES